MIAPSHLPSMTVIPGAPRYGTSITPKSRRRARVNSNGELSIRLAGRRDAGAIRELEQLDSHALTDGARLVATLDGVPVAALAVADDSVVADPFEKTQPVVDLLRIRARQLRIAGTPLAA